jgi:precorrin-3B synthase
VLSLAELAALAGAAARFGNGRIDVTRRANLQIRGVCAATLPGLRALLGDLDLLAADPEVEAARNVMVAPLAGLDPSAVDVRAVARELDGLLAADKRLQALPAKFGYAVDAGGRLPLQGARADVHLRAQPGKGAPSYGVGLDAAQGTQWLGRVPEPAAARTAAAAALGFLAGNGGAGGRMREASDAQRDAIRTAIAPQLMPCAAEEPAPDIAKIVRVGQLELGPQAIVVGVGAPFGRLEEGQLTRLAGVLADAGCGEVRLSPWRVLYAAVGNRAAAEGVLGEAQRAGLITEAVDPLLRIEACPGWTACASACLDTRGIGRLIASHLPGSGFTGTIHISGCSKGCARSAPAELALVASGDRYLVVRQGTAKSSPIASLSPDEVRAAPWRLLQMVRERAHG